MALQSDQFLHVVALNSGLARLLFSTAKSGKRVSMSSAKMHWLSSFAKDSLLELFSRQRHFFFGLSSVVIDRDLEQDLVPIVIL